MRIRILEKVKIINVGQQYSQLYIGTRDGADQTFWLRLQTKANLRATPAPQHLLLLIMYPV